MARDYVFTSWKEPEFDRDGCRYICWGKEIAPSTGREHWQGYVIFKRTAKFPKAKLWIGAGDDTHVECRKGSRDEARNYCKKDGDFFEWGEFEGRNIADIFKLNIAEIKEEYPLFYCRYHRGLEKLKQDQGEKWRSVEVTWLHGPAGCGKTRMVMEMNDVFKCDNMKWWDGYEGESILLLDDVDIEDFSNRRYMLNLLDGYRLRLEIKGGHTWAKWQQVYITSNWDPGDLLRDSAYCRRVTTVTGLG